MIKRKIVKSMALAKGNVWTFLLFLFLFTSAEAARLKDIASIRGMRENQLIGYGLVVGLKGTGDSKAEFTSKAMARMLDKLGMKVESQQVESKNVAGVIVTATLPAFAKSGNNLDVTVSTIGDASSLEGGMLLMTPLRAANEQIFVVAQGSVSLGSSGKDAFTTVGRVPNGGKIERDVGADFAARKMFRLALINADTMTAARTVLTINRELGGQYATAVDPGTIDLVTPAQYEGKGVEFLATIEAIEVNPDMKAKVVINEKTGTVVIGDKVKISRVAVAHGSLSVKILGKTEKENTTEKVMILDSGASVGDLVQVLNKIGVSPKDLISLLQSIKAAGALNGELEIL